MLEMRQSKAAAALQALIRQRVGGQDGAGMRAVQLSAQSRGTEAVFSRAGSPACHRGPRSLRGQSPQLQQALEVG